MAKIRVAVIGAGAAGLAALRRLVEHADIYDVTAYEYTGRVGGTWVYIDRVGTDENGLPIHASMYKNLRTNLPKEVMAFPGFPFKKNLPSFIMHQDVLRYLEDYAHHYQLNKSIKFHTKVDNIRPNLEKDELQWIVSTSPAVKHKDDASTESVQNLFDQIFDAVIVCNGHYSVEMIPEVPNIEEFQGKTMHSHDYRDNHIFKGKRVLILGAASSGTDIALDIAGAASEVLLSHWKSIMQSPLADNVKQVPSVQSATKSGFILQDGQRVEVDVALWCTGYRYTFPFISDECNLQIEGERVIPLYKHIVHTEFPSLFFIGICKLICPFPQFDCQVQFAMAAMERKMELPSKANMNADIKQDYEWRRNTLKMPHRHAHHMGKLQWNYNKQLAVLAGFPPVPDVVQNLYDHVHAERLINLPSYKHINYEIDLISNTFKEVKLP